MSDQETKVIAVPDQRIERTSRLPQVIPQGTDALMATIARAASDPNIDLARMQQLLDMKERVDARNAESAFDEALASFKENVPTVSQDRQNKQYGSTYTSLGNMVNTVNPVLARFGLGASWDIDTSEPKAIKVTCILSGFGHKRKVSMSAPADTSGAKNPIQQIKSTVTYLQVATYQAAVGIATYGTALDDDGNSGGGEDHPTINESQLADLKALLQEVNSTPAALCARLGIKDLSEILAKNLPTVIQIVQARRQRVKP